MKITTEDIIELDKKAFLAHRNRTVEGIGFDQWRKTHWISEQRVREAIERALMHDKEDIQFAPGNYYAAKLKKELGF